MGVATLYPTSVSVVNVSSTLSDYTADDGTYGASTDSGETMLEGSFATPASAPGGDQKVEWDSRKSPGSGTNSPTYDIQLWNSTALVATLGAGLGDELAGSITWSWETYAGSFASDGSDVRLRVQQTGGAGGNPNGRAYIESDYIRWIAAFADNVSVTIGAASTAVSGGAVTVLAPTVAQIASGAVALVGRAVTATVVSTEVIAKTAMSLTGLGVVADVDVKATPATAGFALSAKTVQTHAPTRALIAPAAIATTALVARLNVVAVIAAASTTVSGRDATAVSNLVASILAGSTVLSTGEIQTSVDVIFDATVATMALTGQDVTDRIVVLELIAKSAVQYFGGNVTTIPVGEVAGSNLTRLLSLPGIYTFLWKELVREETIEKL